jgi:PKD repeat protein
LVQKGLWLRVAIPLILAGLALLGGWCLLTTPTTAQGGQPPSSLELIEEAYLRGELDYEAALIYKVYSVFAPDRLPPQFRSDTPSRGATLVLAEVLNAWDSLSTETKILLREFGLGFPLPGEVVPLAQSRPPLTNEEIYDTTHFRIHYTRTGTDAVYHPSEDVNPANGVPDYVDWVAEDLEYVWSAEISSMGWLQPPPDQGEGGDTRYDVYLKNCPGYYGYTNYSGGFVGDNPNSLTVIETDAYYSYMVLENDFAAFPGDRRENIRVTAAHEFNHAIQVGYDGTEATWLMEATATWIEDEVYDDINDNYQFLDKLFSTPDLALDTGYTSYTYSRWIFMRYISEHHGGQTTVRSIWEHAVTQDSMDAVKAALLEVGTDFATLFPRFTAANYVLSDLSPNAPYTYEEADGYKGAAGTIETEAVITFTGTPLTYNSFDQEEDRLERRSAEYIEVRSAVNFQVTFVSHDSTDFVVQGALRYPDGRVTIKQVPLSGGQGTWVVTDPATYNEVIVIVTNRGNTNESSGYDLRFATTSETPPNAVLTADPTSGTISTVFQFDASGSTDAQTPANQLAVRWDWDGDLVYDTDWSTTKTASHSYATPGTYTVTVEVRDAVDLRDTASQVVTVGNTAPTASFTVQPSEGTISTDFAFDASTCNDQETPPTQLQVRWDWENDGVYDTNWSTSKTAAHSYGQPDTYTVCLQVRDEGGLTGTATQVVTVNNTPPTAAFSIDSTTGTTATVFGFDATGSSDLETPLAELQVRWDWETDAAFDTDWSTAKVITHSYDALGVYTITMEVRDTGGLTDTVAHTVTVQSLPPDEQPPTASFTVSPTQGTIDVVFEFDASSSHDNGSNPTPVEELLVRWDWENDGYFDTDWSTTKVSTHSFEQPITYTVALEVKDVAGLTDLFTQTVAVLNTAPTAAFSVNPASGSVHTTFTFDASASNDHETPASALQVHWDLDGDGQYDTPWSTTKTVTYSYSKVGTYTVTLGVRDAQGTTATTTQLLTVADDLPPAAVLTVQPGEGITDTAFSFDATGSSDDFTPQNELGVRWDWENDGSFDTGWSTNKTATHVFSTPGTYVVAVEVRDNQQQTDVARRTVMVYDQQWANERYKMYIPLVLKSYLAQ